MKGAGACLLLLAASTAAAQDDTKGFLGLHDAEMRIHVGDFDLLMSGILEFEHYVFQDEAPGLLTYEGDDGYTSNPRATFFFDVNFGRRWYAFVQVRADRGFDPNWEGHGEARIDEAFGRFTIIQGDSSSLFVQAGKFASPMGNWIPRHDSMKSAFIRSPLIYDYITGIDDAEVPDDNADQVEHRNEPREREEWVTMLWGPQYHIGGMIFGTLDRWEARVALTNGAPSERPDDEWDAQRRVFNLYALAARVGWNPFIGFRVGVNFARGPYLTRHIEDFGVEQESSKQTLYGIDVEYAIGHFQIWAEVYRSEWDVPNVRGTLSCIGGYVEARYAFFPGFYAAARVGEIFFSRIPDGAGSRKTWDRTTWRAEVGVGYFIYVNLLVRAQYEFNHTNGRFDPKDDMLSMAISLSF